jgi:uncharacterized protein (TIGR00369 family)
VSELSLEHALEIIARQPLSQLIGCTVTEVATGRAVLEVPLRRELQNQFAMAHGGTLAFSADLTLTIAGATVLGPDVVTRGFAIDYVRPATGRVVRTEAHVVTHTSRQAVVRCDIYSVDADGTETFCSSAQGTIMARSR